MDKFKATYPNIRINSKYFKYIHIPDKNFLKFPSQKMIVLRDDEHSLKEAYESESIFDMDFLDEVLKRYKLIRNNGCLNNYLFEKEVDVVKAIQAYQIMRLSLDNNNSRGNTGNEGDAYNELLQNVNDYAEPKTCLAISIRNEEADNHSLGDYGV